MTDCGQATSIPSSASIRLLPHANVPSAPEHPWFASRAQRSSPLPSCTWHSPSLAQQQLHPSYARLGRRSLAHPIRQQPAKPAVLNRCVNSIPSRQQKVPARESCTVTRSVSRCATSRGASDRPVGHGYCSDLSNTTPSGRKRRTRQYAVLQVNSFYQGRQKERT